MLEKNKEYDVSIIDMTHEGAGIAKIDGFIVFVEGAITGEIVKIRIVKVLKKFSYGRVVKFIKRSEDRRVPTCENYKRCGGCSLQHMRYDKTLAFKHNVVSNNLKKYARLDIKVEDVIGLEEPFSYRNKAQYPVGQSDTGVKIGFFAKRTHDIVPVSDCSIQSKIANGIIRDIKNIIRDEKISAYDEETKRGLIRHILIKTAEHTGEVMVVIVTNGEKFDKSRVFVNKLIERNPNIVSIIQNVNTKHTNVILGEKDIVIYGKERITDYIGELRFEISAKSFFQVNPKQTRVLYNKVLEYLGPTGNEIVFDLYCGIGTISLFLARYAKTVYGVEVVREAVADARINAMLNDIENVEFIYGKTEDVLPSLCKKGIKPDVVVLDPPRSGCEASVIETINKMGAKKVVYVSCNSATLARDLTLFSGYFVEKVQPVDMFPWTSHTETIVLLQRL